jgi:hypothetical protein
MTQRAHARVAWTALAVAAIAVGIGLRCWQLGSQILIDDEWHAIHVLLGNDYGGIATHFGVADYSIPLTAYYRFLYDHGGLSEWGMRLPPLAAGIGLLLAAMFAWRRETSLPTRAIWTMLLAISPVLVYLSRVARPYALTCLLTLLALMAFRAWWTRRTRLAALGYVAATVLAGWLHLLSLCFCLAPFLYYGVTTLRDLAARPRMRRGAGQEPKCLEGQGRTREVAAHDFLRLTALGLATVLPLGAVLLPPVLGDWHTLAGKAGSDAMTWASAWRTLLMLFGVRYAWLSILLLALGGLGAVSLWRRERDLAAYLATAVMAAAAAIIVARPAWIHHPGVCTRYLLPALPIVLLFVAEGTAALLERLRAMSLAPLALPFAAAGLVFAGPMPDYLYTPNQFMAHALFQFDVDPEQNLFVNDHRNDPVPEFFRELGGRPPQSLTLIEMPWLAISDALYPWYQRIHRQNVRLGLAVPECGAEPVFGEYPETAAGLRLTQYVHLSELLRGQTSGADYLIVRPQPWRAREVTGLAWPDMQQCLPQIRERFGAPVFEDAQIIVFALPKP